LAAAHVSDSVQPPRHTMPKSNISELKS